MPLETARQLSRESLRNLPDNTIITSAADGTAYLVRAGRREQIMNPAQLAAAGVNAQQARRLELTADQVNAIPSGGFLPLGTTGASSFESGDVFLGSGHYMHTWGTLDHSSGQLAAQTRTRTVTWYGGFHGSVHVILADTMDCPVWTSEDHRYAVDGTWVGRSDRTDAWWETMAAADTTRVQRCYIFQAWEPDTFMTILDKWIAASKSVSEFAAQISSVAKVIATTSG